MKVVGFSFIRNAVKYHFPIEEALRSILPLCDEVIVAVGASEDNTRDLIASIDPKIRIIDTVWDETVREEGRVLALETNKAMKAIPPDADWCIYIQGDEVLHEDGYAEIRAAMQRWKDDARVDGLLFRYRHFYGSYDYVGTASRWYKNEIRIVRNDPSIYSFRDAQGFRKGNNEKLRVKPLQAYIHHYGWVRPPAAMEAKRQRFGRLWGGPNSGEPPLDAGDFEYEKHIEALEKFTGKHPAVMQSRINQVNWQFSYDISYSRLKFKDRVKNFLEKLTGRRFFDYRNYKVI